MPKLNQSLILKHLPQLVNDQDFHTAVFQLIQIRERNNYCKSQQTIRLTMLVARAKELLPKLQLRPLLNQAIALNLINQPGEHSRLLCTIPGNLDKKLGLHSQSLRPQGLCNRINQFKKEATYLQMFLSHPQMPCFGEI